MIEQKDSQTNVLVASGKNKVQGILSGRQRGNFRAILASIHTNTSFLKQTLASSDMELFSGRHLVFVGRLRVSGP